MLDGAGCELSGQTVTNFIRRRCQVAAWWRMWVRLAQCYRKLMTKVERLILTSRTQQHGHRVMCTAMLFASHHARDIDSDSDRDNDEFAVDSGTAWLSVLSVRCFGWRGSLKPRSGFRFQASQTLKVVTVQASLGLDIEKVRRARPARCRKEAREGHLYTSTQHLCTQHLLFFSIFLFLQVSSAYAASGYETLSP